jgi:TonB-linked SusC/RagA family outer membrane protein
MKKIINLFLVITAFVATSNVVAQNIKVTSKITDKEGNALSGVLITADTKTTISNLEGVFTIDIPSTETLVFELDKYQTKYILASDVVDNNIELNYLGHGFGENSNLLLPFRETTKNNSTGAVSVIPSDALNGIVDINLYSTLKGKAAGLFVSEEPAEHGMSDYRVNIRGFGANNTPLVIVDGAERSLEYLQNTDIESISVLKDAVSKSFYKGKAANGVLLVTTKRGQRHKNIRTFSVETGVSTPTFIAQPLNSFEYASYYNLAQRNTGLSNLYSAQEIDAYRNPNAQYPSNNYYDELIRNNSFMTKISTNFNGGGEKILYNVNANYIYNGGIENVGESNSYYQYTFRSNLDFKVNNIVDAFVDVYGYLSKINRNSTAGNTIFSRMSIQRPNEYAFLLDDVNNISADSDFVYGSGRLGVNSGNYQNLYAEMLEGGTREDIRRLVQTNFGLKFDLNSVLNGLTGTAAISFDSFTYLATGKNNNISSYIPIWENNTLVDLAIATVGSENANNSRLASDGFSQYTATAKLNYNKEFNNNKLNLGYVFFTDKREYINNTNNNLIPESMSHTLLANYSLNNKWIVDFNLGYVGSPKFDKDNQYDFFPAVGLGWVLSEENFLNSSKNINYLKLKASYGVTPTDNNLDYFGYKTRYNYYGSGSTNFGLTAGDGVRSNELSSYLNTSLDWEKSKELNIGFEAVILNNFTANFDYYKMDRSDVPIYQNLISNQVSGLYNNQINFVSINTNGVDGTLSYNKKAVNWEFNASLNANYALAKYEQSSSLDNLPENRNFDGKPVDAFFGLTSNGIITTSGELSNANQAFGDLKIGDLAYQDINNDGTVNQNDVSEIGNSLPRLHYGTTISAKYKNVGLIVSGYGASMFDIYLNNSYFRPASDRAYFAPVRNAYNPETGIGSDPALTVGNTSNNYRLSDHWLADGSYFKIKEVELSYSLSSNVVKRMNLDNLKLYVRANNLATFSGVKDVDPEYINAGFSSYPFMRTFALGMNLKF